MEEEELQTSIETYRQQLSHVEQAIQAAGSTPDLSTLKNDLKELIKLTEDSLLSLRKSQLLKQLDNDEDDIKPESSSSSSSSSHVKDTTTSNHLDDEYAAFQAMLGGDTSHVQQTVNKTEHVESVNNQSYHSKPSTSDNKTFRHKDNVSIDLHREYNQTLSTEYTGKTKNTENPKFTEKTEYNGKTEYTGKTKKTEYTGKTEKTEYTGKTEKTEYTGKTEHTEESMECNQSLTVLYKDIIGTKCRAPYVHEWGAKTYSNALITSIECVSDLDLPKVKVMFCNPTLTSMLPCKYYLNGNCRFDEEDCRFSHGHIVEMEDLQEYRDPDFSLLKLESRCLARYDDDDLWYKATVVEVNDDNVKVTFDTYDDEPITLPYNDVLLLDEQDDTDDDDDDYKEILHNGDDNDDDDLPVYLWKPPTIGLGDLGQWEAHTKGIGSKLLTKMGYKPGQGLGRSGEGRIQPVPIQLLPPGKSLDKIMALKERTGQRDMFDVMKKQEKTSKKHGEKLKQHCNKPTNKSDVFDFINKKLHGKKGKLSELIHNHEDGREAGHGRKHNTISEKELKTKSDRNINIQLLKTSEEIKSVHTELYKLRESLSRNENSDRNMASQVRKKIQSLEIYLEKLKSSELTMQNHKQRRSDHKKLTVF
ncbi:hypothetical protein ACF0H5_021426 [Mactra antiquata]